MVLYKHNSFFDKEIATVKIFSNDSVNKESKQVIRPPPLNNSTKSNKPLFWSTFRYLYYERITRTNAISLS